MDVVIVLVTRRHRNHMRDHCYCCVYFCVLFTSPITIFCGVAAQWMDEKKHSCRVTVFCFLFREESVRGWMSGGVSSVVHRGTVVVVVVVIMHVAKNKIE